MGLTTPSEDVHEDCVGGRGVCAVRLSTTYDARPFAVTGRPQDAREILTSTLFTVTFRHCPGF